MSGEKVAVTVELTDEQAQAAMANSAVTAGLETQDVRQSAASDEEAYLMRDSFNAMQYALTDAGYSPR